MNYKLENVSKGYAEVWSEEHDTRWGVIERLTFIDHTDFEKDEIYEVKRWVAGTYWVESNYAFAGFYPVGRKTGYRTRKEAIEALVKYWEGELK